MIKKRVVINADDFGICEETNRAIKELSSKGLISSTSLLVNAQVTEQAVAMIKENSINFGIHLTLNSDFSEAPWRATATEALSLKDEKGFLYSDTKYIGKNAKYKDVVAECEAQISKVESWGIKPDHLDNHSGTMYGINLRPFFLIAFKLSKKYKLPFRFPKNKAFLADFFSGKIPWYISLAHKAILASSRLYKAQLIDDMISNPYSIKDISSYKDLESYYLNKVQEIKPGVTEIFLHPSYHSKQFANLSPEWLKREYELELLMSGSLQKRLEEEGIEVISYKDI